jgi:hypothetical protein
MAARIGSPDGERSASSKCGTPLIMPKIPCEYSRARALQSLPIGMA